MRRPVVAIKSFQDRREDLELAWLAGPKETPLADWQIHAATRPLSSDRIDVHHLPIGALPVLSPGRCYTDGIASTVPVRGEMATIRIENVADGEEVPAACIPTTLYSVPEHPLRYQRLYHYKVGHLDILVPTIELVRFLFLHNKTMANAVMRCGALMELFQPEPLRLGGHLHLRFTKLMPASALSRGFVQEFAWTGVHEDGRKSWDSVWERSAGRKFVSFDPPPLRDSEWLVRWVRHGDTALVLEIYQASGKTHPCDTLSFSHPSIRRKLTFRPKASPDVGEDLEEDQPREINDYIVDECSGGSRTDVHQSVLPGPFKVSSFDREIKITKVVETVPTKDDREVGGNGESEAPPASRRKRASASIRRQRIRVPASLAEAGFNATLPPVEFELLEPAEPGFVGELKPLLDALRLMKEDLPAVSIAVSLCSLKRGRAFSMSGRHRRPCLVAVIRPPSQGPLVLLDVDHSGGWKLASLLLKYREGLPFRAIEERVKDLLDNLVGNGGKWQASERIPSIPDCACVRLPRILRRHARINELAYRKVWAARLAEWLGIADLRLSNL